jgi:hypothetical protein
MTYNNTPIAMLKSPTGMAVRVQAAMINAVGVDMDRWNMLNDRLDRFMAVPGFDMAEFHRLCKVYGLD